MSVGKPAAVPVFRSLCFAQLPGALKGVLQLFLVDLQESVSQRISVWFCVYSKHSYWSIRPGYSWGHGGTWVTLSRTRIQTAGYNKVAGMLCEAGSHICLQVVVAGTDGDPAQSITEGILGSIWHYSVLCGPRKSSMGSMCMFPNRVQESGMKLTLWVFHCPGSENVTVIVTNGIILDTRLPEISADHDGYFAE